MGCDGMEELRDMCRMIKITCIHHHELTILSFKNRDLSLMFSTHIASAVNMMDFLPKVYVDTPHICDTPSFPLLWTIPYYVVPYFISTELQCRHHFK